jgi:hypothetical protein
LFEPGLTALGAGFDASGPCGVNGFVNVVGFVVGCAAFSSGLVPVASGPCGISGFIDLVACAAFGSDGAPVGAVCANAAAVVSAMRTATADPATDDENRRDMCVLLVQVDGLCFSTEASARSGLAARPIAATRGKSAAICERALIWCA